jgi:aryl-alcohol dehydrogenase-like predicted oxidoreductase
VHWPDPLVEIEETAEAMRSLLQQGKIRAIGVSNFSVAQMERFRRIAPLHVVQPPYNLFERAIEAEILPYCRENGIATFGYGALCRGLLSGRMRNGSKVTTFAAAIRNSGNRVSRSICRPYSSSTNSCRSSSEGASSTWRSAGCWIRESRPRCGGARHPGQLQPVDSVSGWRLDAAAKAEIDRILEATISDPVGPEFMAPPARRMAA